MHYAGYVAFRKKTKIHKKTKNASQRIQKMQNRAKFRAPHSIEKCYTRLSLED